MKTLKSVIEDIKNLRGADVTIFGQPTTLDSEVSRFTIDVIDVLEAVEEFEIDGDDLDIDSLTFIQADNTYNWNSPISNDFNFEVYQNEDGYCFKLSVHRYGDVRCNYTDDVWFYFDNEYTFYELVGETTIYETVEIDGRCYNVDINVFSETMEVYNDNGDYICSVCGYDENDIIADIKNNIE